MTTTPDSAAQGGVTVTQADVTFANHIIAGFRKISKNEWFANASVDHWLAKDIARHRLASSPPAQRAGVEDALREALENAREAMAPFADCASEYIADDESDEEWAKFRLIVKQWRDLRSAYDRARAALRPSTDAAAQPTDAGVGE